MFTVPTYFFGYMLMAYALHPIMFTTGRILTGFGLGLTLSIPSVYIVDITSIEHRGTLGVIPNVMVQLGIFLTN